MVVKYWKLKGLKIFSKCDLNSFLNWRQGNEPKEFWDPLLSLYDPWLPLWKSDESYGPRTMCMFVYIQFCGGLCMLLKPVHGPLLPALNLLDFQIQDFGNKTLKVLKIRYMYVKLSLNSKDTALYCSCLICQMHKTQW